MFRSMTARAPYRHVVVGTDGSTFSANALVGGARLAQQSAAELHVLHASGSAESGFLIASDSAALLGDQPYKLEIRDLVNSSPARLIAEYATELGGEAVVAVGTRGRGGVGASILGSTAAGLLARTGQTTLAFGPEAAHPLEIERVVVCVDGSQFSEASVPEGVRWARTLDVPMRLVQVVPAYLSSYVRVVESVYVCSLARDLKGLQSGVEWDVLHSTSPVRSILEEFGNDAATLLIMATHGRVGLQRVLVGSIALDVVTGARGPIVMVRPQV